MLSWRWCGSSDVTRILLIRIYLFLMQLWWSFSYILGADHLPTSQLCRYFSFFWEFYKDNTKYQLKKKGWPRPPRPTPKSALEFWDSMSRIKFVEDYKKNLYFCKVFIQSWTWAFFFCNGDFVNAQTWEVLPPGETCFSRATLRVHVFAGFFFVYHRTAIVYRFIQG